MNFEFIKTECIIIELEDRRDNNTNYFQSHGHILMPDCNLNKKNFTSVPNVVVMKFHKAKFLI